MENEKEIKRCPFRKSEDGEFAPRYGNGCMAYTEYDQPVISMSTQCGVESPLAHLTICKRMPSPVPVYYGGGRNV